MNVLIGADIGGTRIKFGAFTEDGNLIEKWSAGTDLRDNGGRIMPQIAEEIRRYCGMEHTVAGIGMGIPGPVDPNGHVRNCVNLHWNDFNPVGKLRAFFPDIPVAAENDANVAALGEYCGGAGRGYKSMMMITLGTGVGGGAVVDGKILPGAHGLAGEIGHIAPDSSVTVTCSCGNTGCINQVSSATGIVFFMKEYLKEHPGQSGLEGKEDLFAKDVCDAAAAGDPAAMDVLEYCMRPLGKGMAMFSHAFDPEVFVIGGGVCEAGSLITDLLQKYYRQNLFLIREGAKIVCAQLKNDAGITGACMLVRK